MKLFYAILVSFSFLLVSCRSNKSSDETEKENRNIQDTTQLEVIGVEEIPSVNASVYSQNAEAEIEYFELPARFDTTTMLVHANNLNPWEHSRTVKTFIDTTGEYWLNVSVECTVLSHFYLSIWLSEGEDDTIESSNRNFSFSRALPYVATSKFMSANSGFSSYAIVDIDTNYIISVNTIFPANPKEESLEQVVKSDTIYLVH